VTKLGELVPLRAGGAIAIDSVSNGVEQVLSAIGSVAFALASSR